MKVKLFFCGDVYLGDENKTASICGGELEDIMSACRIRCCNLEGSFARKDFKFQKILKAGPSLIQSQNAAKILLMSGFNTFCMANNHIMDYGEEALKFTQEELDGYTQVGVSNLPEYVELDLEGVKIALFSVAENSFGCERCTEGIGYLHFLREGLYEKISDIKKQGKYVIVNVHGGAEILDIPLPEIRRLYRSYVDAGADLVVGHHPHVLQGYEDYQGGRIYYSLGNFYFDREQEPLCMIGGGNYSYIKFKFRSSA